MIKIYQYFSWLDMMNYINFSLNLQYYYLFFFDYLIYLLQKFNKQDATNTKCHKCSIAKFFGMSINQHKKKLNIYKRKKLCMALSAIELSTQFS